MLLQGFRDLLNALMGNNTQRIKLYSTTTDVYITNGVSEVGLSKKLYNGDYVASHSANNASQPAIKYYSIIVGDGDTTPTFADRCLSGDTSSVLSVGTYSQSNNKIIVSATFNPSVDYTVKEVGLVIGGTAVSILLSRTVLSEPVVMKAGDTKTFSVTIDMNKFFDTATVS